jgi:PAS domain S-box-containing protein
MPEALPWQDGTMDICALWLSTLAASLILFRAVSKRGRENDEARFRACLQEKEMALIECQDRFLRLAGKMREVVWIVSVGRRQTVFVNAAFEKITGRTCQSLYDKPDCRDLIHPDDRALAVTNLVRQVLEKENGAIEFRIVRADDATRWVRCRAFLFSIGFRAGNQIGWIVEDITERRQARETLRRIFGRLQQAQDDERRRIARELHDSTAQMLTALILNLTSLRESKARWSGKTRRALSESLALASQCSREVRTISYLLHPPLLEEIGLISALRHFVAGLTQRGDIRVSLEVAAEFDRLPPEFELCLFRVVQEGLMNILRHSGSTTARVRILQNAGVVVLEVSDEGHGLPLKLVGYGERILAAPGVGMAGMQERVEQLGGWVEIESGIQGTTVRAFLPYKPLDLS